MSSKSAGRMEIEGSLRSCGSAPVKAAARNKAAESRFQSSRQLSPRDSIFMGGSGIFCEQGGGLFLFLD